jgi:hypothetical protein
MLSMVLWVATPRSLETDVSNEHTASIFWPKRNPDEEQVVAGGTNSVSYPPQLVTCLACSSLHENSGDTFPRSSGLIFEGLHDVTSHSIELFETYSV